MNKFKVRLEEDIYIGEEFVPKGTILYVHNNVVEFKDSDGQNIKLPASQLPQEVEEISMHNEFAPVIEWMRESKVEKFVDLSKVFKRGNDFIYKGDLKISGFEPLPLLQPIPFTEIIGDLIIFSVSCTSFGKLKRIGGNLEVSETDWLDSKSWEQILCDENHPDARPYREITNDRKYRDKYYREIPSGVIVGGDIHSPI